MNLLAREGVNKKKLAADTSRKAPTPPLHQKVEKHFLTNWCFSNYFWMHIRVVLNMMILITILQQYMNFERF